MRYSSRSYHVFICLLGALLGPATASGRGPARGDKTGPFMLNLKVGPAIPIYVQDYNGSALDIVPVAAAIQIEAGVAINAARSAYLVLPFEIQVGSRSS